MNDLLIALGSIGLGVALFIAAMRGFDRHERRMFRIDLRERIGGSNE